ncbi:MAG: thioredoxin family protein [Anaerolineae bacterium]
MPSKLHSHSSFLSYVILVTVLAAIVLSGCSSAPSQPSAEATTSAPTITPLTGVVTRADIEGHTGWEQLRGQDYTPASDDINAIRSGNQDIKVLVFLGTWCSDTKRELPRFFKIMDQAGITEDQVTLIALDRTKKDANGLTDEWQIEYVPTFIFTRNGQELGRIVETPQGTLEGNIAQILQTT